MGKDSTVSYVNTESKNPLRSAVLIRRISAHDVLMYVGTLLETRVGVDYFKDEKLKCPEEIEKQT